MSTTLLHHVTASSPPLSAAAVPGLFQWSSSVTHRCRTQQQQGLCALNIDRILATPHDDIPSPSHTYTRLTTLGAAKHTAATDSANFRPPSVRHSADCKALPTVLSKDQWLYVNLYHLFQPTDLLPSVQNMKTKRLERASTVTDSNKQQTSKKWPI